MKVELVTLTALLVTSVSTASIPEAISKRQTYRRVSSGSSSAVKSNATPILVTEPIIKNETTHYPVFNFTLRDAAIQVYKLSPAIYDALGQTAHWNTRNSLLTKQTWKDREMDQWSMFWIDSWYDADDSRNFFQQLLDHPFIDVDEKNCQIESEYSQCNSGNIAKLDPRFSGTMNNTRLNALLFFQAVSNFQGTFHYSNSAFTDAKAELALQLTNTVANLAKLPPTAPPDHTLEIIFNVLQVALLVLPLTSFPAWAASAATSAAIKSSASAVTDKYAKVLADAVKDKKTRDTLLRIALDDPIYRSVIDGVVKKAQDSTALVNRLTNNIQTEISTAKKVITAAEKSVEAGIVAGLRSADSFAKVATSMYAIGSVYVDYAGGVKLSVNPAEVSARVGDQLQSFRQQLAIMYKSTLQVPPAVPGGLLDYLREGNYLPSVQAQIQSQMERKLVSYVYHWVVEKVYGLGNGEVVIFKKRYDNCDLCNQAKKNFPGEICTPGVTYVPAEYYANNPNSCYYFYPTHMQLNDLKTVYVTPDHYDKYINYEVPGFGALAQAPLNYDLAEIYWRAWETSREALQHRDKRDLWQSAGFSLGPSTNSKSLPTSFPVLDPDDPIQGDRCESAGIFEQIYYMLDDYAFFGLNAKYKYPKCRGVDNFCSFWFWRLADVRHRMLGEVPGDYAKAFMETYKASQMLQAHLKSDSRFCIAPRINGWFW